MTDNERDYWFRAKRYGWGWGLPTRWQGWLVMILWSGSVILGSLWLAPRSTPQFLVFMGIMVALLIWICWATGEPPRWRWGNDDRNN